LAYEYDLRKFFTEPMYTKRRRNIAENFYRLSMAHERYRRQTDRRQRDGRRHIANVNAKNTGLKSCVLVPSLPLSPVTYYVTY